MTATPANSRTRYLLTAFSTAFWAAHEFDCPSLERQAASAAATGSLGVSNLTLCEDDMTVRKPNEKRHPRGSKSLAVRRQMLLVVGEEGHMSQNALITKIIERRTGINPGTVNSLVRRNVASLARDGILEIERGSKGMSLSLTNKGLELVFANAGLATYALAVGRSKRSEYDHLRPFYDAVTRSGRLSAALKHGALNDRTRIEFRQVSAGLTVVTPFNFISEVVRILATDEYARNEVGEDLVQQIEELASRYGAELESVAHEFQDAASSLH